MQTTYLDPVQIPDSQVSVCEQASPSLHDVPFGAMGFEQRPVAGLQIPATWHASLAVQTTGFEPVQIPEWHVSVWVHLFRSLHEIPSGARGFEHRPVAGLQVPTRWHVSLSAHSTEVPAHAPPLH